MSSEPRALYVNVFVAIERLRRARRRAEADHARWQRRTMIAAAKGELELAQAARRMVALADENVATFSKALAMQEQTLITLKYALAMDQ